MYAPRAVSRRLVACLASLALLAPAASAAPRPTARAWLVQNGATGEVLLRHNERARLPIASITKLMTVLVALEHARLADVVTVPAAAASVGESSVNLRAGERWTVRDLVEAALIQSANDAATALAAHAGGGSVERFVALMNRKARALGLRETHFVRPDGLDVAGHVSSARDVTKLARVAMQRPAIRAIVARRQEVAAGRRLHTWNDLLGRFPGVVGVKTGHTAAAGWSQIAAARAPGRTIYATILGSPSRTTRNADLAGLLAWGISRYRVVDAVRAGRVYAHARAPFGRDPVPLVAQAALVRVVRVDRPLTERVVAVTAVALPVRKGDRLGEVRVYAGRKLLGSRALVAARTVQQPRALARARWYAGRTLSNTWEMITP